MSKTGNARRSRGAGASAFGTSGSKETTTASREWVAGPGTQIPLSALASSMG
jgi:hypothetical protein